MLPSPSSLPLLLHCVSLAGLLEAEGLCADVPGERPAPLPWENMWSGSVYAGILSSYLPHSMLASVSPRWQSSALPPQRGHSQVEVTLATVVDKQERQQFKWKSKQIHLNKKYVFKSSKKTNNLNAWIYSLGGKVLNSAVLTFFVFMFCLDSGRKNMLIFRHLRHVFHRFSTYFTFSPVIQTLSKHL